MMKTEKTGMMHRSLLVTFSKGNEIHENVKIQRNEATVPLHQDVGKNAREECGII